MQSAFHHNYWHGDNRVRQSWALWAFQGFPLGVLPFEQPFLIHLSQVRALCKIVFSKIALAMVKQKRGGGEICDKAPFAILQQWF